MKIFTKGTEGNNKCRNPDGGDTIWCYTMDKKKRWEYCDPINASNVETCSGKKCKKYRGKQNFTIAGRECQAWAK